jgi:hypothetical protein
MIATTEQEMIREVMEATGLPEAVAREIVAVEMGDSPGDVIADGREDGLLAPEASILKV